MEPTAPPPPPPPLPDVLTNVIQQINNLHRKNTTMIDYYIHPSPVPTDIASYEPRLLIFRTRVQNLAQLELTQISWLVDNAAALIAAYVLPNIGQLAASCVGIQNLFINHYDRRLEESQPYSTIFRTLRYCEQCLHQIAAAPRRQLPEILIPTPSASTPSLCRGAIAFLNNRDSGKVSSVSSTDLLAQHQGRLADRGGVVLWWECSACAFRLRYHASQSVNLGINSTDEVLIEDDVINIAYRSAWLAKCHIYHPRQPKPTVPSPPTSPIIKDVEPMFSRMGFQDPIWHAAPEPVPTPPPARPAQRPQNPKRVSFSRRKSSGNPTATLFTTTTRVRGRSPSPPAPPLMPLPSALHNPLSQPQLHPQSPHHHHHHHHHRTHSHSKPKKPKPPPEPSGPDNLRYYCPFCIAIGKQLTGPPPSTSSSSSSSSDDAPEPTCFSDAKEFMEHIEDRHTRDRPVSLLLQRLRVAVNGEMSTGPEGKTARWDLDLR